jgi:hypothetical protein
MPPAAKEETGEVIRRVSFTTTFVVVFLEETMSTGDYGNSSHVGGGLADVRHGELIQR